MGTYDDITQAESSGNLTKPNPRSSALGLGQFVNGTWLDMIRRYHPELAQDKSDAEILDLRKDPKLSREMTENYAKENEAKLRQAGIPVTPGSTYLMHFAGPSGGIALMKADPDTPVESILSDHAIKANPYLQGKTGSGGLGQTGDRNDAGADRAQLAQTDFDPSGPSQRAGATPRLTSIYPEVGPLGPNLPAPRSGSDMLSAGWQQPERAVVSTRVVSACGAAFAGSQPRIARFGQAAPVQSGCIAGTRCPRRHSGIADATRRVRSIAA